MKNMRKTKEQLKQEAALHQKAIESEFHLVVEEGKSTAKKAAYVAGGILAGFLLIRLLTRKKVVEKPVAGVFSHHEQPAHRQKSGIMSTVGKMLLTEAAVLGIRFAKDRIKDYFEHSDHNEGSTENPE